MVTTLVSSPLVHDTAPQMPDVFIVPPEEDDAPAWCYFNANGATPLESLLETTPDLTFLNGALSVFETESHPSMFHCDAAGPFASHNKVILPRKCLDTRSIMDVLMNDDYLESDDEMDLDLDHEVSSGRGAGNDSEIVEVVKVRRHADDIEEHARIPTPPAKRTKSFKSRASKAFRSLKNVGKGSLRTKSKAQDIFTSSPIAEAEPPPRSKTPIMSRRGSAIFSQLFSPPSKLQPCSSVSSFDAVRGSPKSPPPTGTYPSSLYDHSPSGPHPVLPSTCSSSLNFDQDFRSSSPTPSAQTKSNRRRFSMMSLQRIFSFSQADEFSDVTPVTISRDSSGPSTSSSSGPDTPTEELASLPPHFGLEDHGTFSQKRGATTVPALGQGEISIEMRLDSFHFESLSFDAERF